MKFWIYWGGTNLKFGVQICLRISLELQIHKYLVFMILFPSALLITPVGGEWSYLVTFKSNMLSFGCPTF